MIERDDTRIIEPKAAEEEVRFETGLRPGSLSDFIGQNTLKSNLKVMLEAATGRGESLEHVLLYGNPGLGKTTLAHIVAKEMGSNMKITSGPALERVGDLAAILSNLKKGDVLFIDEIHRMNRSIEEVLYPAMEDFALDIVVGKGPTARTLRIDLEKFTLIGATTRLSLLTAPLRDRFGAVFHLNFYEPEDIAAIIKRSAQLLDIGIEQDAIASLSVRSRCTPRIANRLLKRLRDFAQVRASGMITDAVANDALTQLEVDSYGLDAVDRRILAAIIETFRGGPVGLTTLAAATQEEVETIEEVIEPFLLRMGLLDRTPRGRTATPKAYEHLGYPGTMKTLWST